MGGGREEEERREGGMGVWEGGKGGCGWVGEEAVDGRTSRGGGGRERRSVVLSLRLKWAGEGEE